ncbi:MAG: hypothetical protein RIS94_1015 [Pseudomonadota bacterium]|jgi:hypothetical protein
MIALPILLMGVPVPDSAPVLAAVKGCDRGEIRSMIRGEPHRRTEFAAAVYAEQRAIATERATLLAGPADQTVALAQLDARQKELEDARAIERAWRDLFDEARADYLANCSPASAAGKKDAQ